MLKKDSAFRKVLIALFFIIGLVFVFWGFGLTGQLTGLLIMLLGIVFLLLALFVYNAPYFVKKD